MKLELDSQKILSFLKPHWALTVMIVMVAASTFTVFLAHFVAFLSGVPFNSDGNMATFISAMIGGVIAACVFLTIRFG